MFGNNHNKSKLHHEEIKSRLQSGNACYHLVQNLLSSSLLANNIKVEIYRTTVLSVFLYGRETWCFTLRERHRLQVFKRTVLRKIFGFQMGKLTWERRKLHYK